MVSVELASECCHDTCVIHELRSRVLLYIFASSFVRFPNQSPSRSSTTQGDVLILIALRDSTNYATWKASREDWDKLEPTMTRAEAAACKPAGVIFDHNGRVTEIELQSKGLSGVNMTSCPNINPANFWIYCAGEIPDFSKCTALRSLDLGDNVLEGEHILMSTHQSD